MINTDNLQIYNDTQSVHNHSIQESIRNSIEKITQQSFKINKESIMESIVSDSILSSQCISSLFEYSKCDDIHSLLLIKFSELLSYVWKTIEEFPLDQQIEIKKILNTEMDDAECKCFTGRMSRLVNCLNGFSPLINIQINDSQQI